METTRELPRASASLSAWSRLPLLLFRALGIALALFGAFLALANEVEIDTDGLGVILALSVAAGLAGAFAWSAREPRIDSVLWQDRAETVIRWALGFIFIVYGLAKIFRNQFPDASYYLLDQPVGDLPGIQITWRFFGYSYAYACFVALSQIGSSLLLFFRRTQLLGACLLLPVIGNIVFINFTHHIPVKFNSCVYLAMTLYLVLADFGRLKALFWDNAPVPPRPHPPLNPRHRGLRAALTTALIVLAFIWPMRIIRAISAEIAPVETPVAGAWRVDDVQGGPPMDRAGQWEKIYFERLFKGREGAVGFRDGHAGLTFAADPARHTLQFDVKGKPPQPPRKFEGTYQFLSDKQLLLRGRLDGQPVRIELKRLR